MSYRVLCQDRKRADGAIALVQDVSREAIERAEPLSTMPPPASVHLHVKPGEPPDFLDGGMPLHTTDGGQLLRVPYIVISERMRQALDAAGVCEIKYLPARLEVALHCQRWTHEGYWLAFARTVIACADDTRHRASPADEPQGEIERFAVNESRTHQAPLFRLAENERALLVSKPLRRQLERAKLRGLEFRRPERWDRGRARGWLQMLSRPRMVLYGLAMGIPYLMFALLKDLRIRLRCWARRR